jgi:hypothetical protein
MPISHADLTFDGFPEVFSRARNPKGSLCASRRKAKRLLYGHAITDRLALSSLQDRPMTTERVMYKAGDYFVECVPERKNFGWQCTLYFSRIDDYRHAGALCKVSLVSPTISGTRLAAEYESMMWARQYQQAHWDELEFALNVRQSCFMADSTRFLRAGRSEKA